MTTSGQTSASSTGSKGSAFRKPSYKRSVAILSTSGIVFGLGLSGSIQAFANPTADCVGNTVTPATTGTLEEKEIANHLNISNEIREANGIVCLNGHFDLDAQVYFNSNAKVYGLGTSSITSRWGTVFQSDFIDSAFFDIEIINLSIIDSMGTAVIGGDVSVVGSNISGNEVAGNGGAIYSSGNVTISNSTLSDNTATRGGAIWALGNITISNNSTLSGNISSEDAGAITSGGEVTITNSTLSGNLATGSGGAIHAYNDFNVTISNSTLSGNTASGSGSGGALRASGIVSISNSTLSGNTASGSGGAIHGDLSITISNSTLSGNTALSGGAIYVPSWQSTLSLQNSTLTGNTATDEGGAVFVTGSLSVSGSTMSGNSTGASGGALWVDRTSTIDNSTFSNNSADYSGGAIRGYGTITSTGSTFSNNTAGEGGALYGFRDYGEGGRVEVSNSSFFGNTGRFPGSEGGAIYAYDGEVFFSTFVNNTASTPPDEPGDTPGNSIYKTGEGQFEIGGNIFAGSSGYPQLGFGLPAPAAFTDLGGNVFSTSTTDETDLAEDPSLSPELQEKDETSVFGKSLLSIFGTATPSLATYSPNTTQALGLVPGSPALNAVPNRAPFNTFTIDQRGATRSFPSSAGAFEGVAPVAPTPTPTSSTAPAALAKTGSENPFWASFASGSMIVVGGLVTAVASRLRRRTK